MPPAPPSPQPYSTSREDPMSRYSQESYSNSEAAGQVSI